MEENELKLSTQTLKKDVLYNIIQATMNHDYKSLVEWLLSYRFGNTSLWDEFELNARHLSREITPLLKTFRKKLHWNLFEQVDELYNSKIKSLLSDFLIKHKKIVVHVHPVYSALIEICENIKVKNENDLKVILQLLEELYQSVSTLNSSDLYNDNVMKYEHELADHLFLLNEFITIFTDIYNEKVKKTKELFAEPMAVSIKDEKDIRMWIEEVNSKINNLKDDKAISEKEKIGFITAFTEKKTELTVLLEEVQKKRTHLYSLSGEIIESYARIKEFITSLRTQLHSFKARDKYLSSLVDLEKKIPALKERTENFFKFDGLDKNELKRSSIILNSDLQDQIIQAVLDQGMINHIIYSDKDIITEELHLLSDNKSQDISTIEEISLDET